MPDHGQGRVHRFREHVVAGVNWRPTRFVDEVPNSRVCSLCRTIPKRTLLLPCGHALCQSCYAASLEGGVGRCPLDLVQFEEAECVGSEITTRIENTLKVYCWNEAHGCEYMGTLDRMLEHYEKECTFHTVECLRCGEGVQHSDLPTHYVTRCSAGVPSAITECPSSQATALTLADVNADTKNLKAILGDLIHDQLLPVMQSQLNELTEQVRKQETRFAGITREMGTSERNSKGDMAQIAATISPTVSHRLTSQPNPAEEASTSSSLSLRSEKTLILRKLERLADLEHSRQTSPKSVSSRVIPHCETLCVDVRHLTSALSTTATRIREIGSVDYFLTLENCYEIIQWQGSRKKFAEIRVWHMRDTYFTVAVSKGFGISAPVLTVEVEFNGMLVDSRCWPPFWHVSVWDNVMRNHRSLTSRAMSCSCDRYDDSLQHFHLEFHIDIASLNNDNFLRDGKITFQILLSNTEMDGGVKEEP
ncbi:uncharacterized protein [Dermacentor andersoni]|uniref:uncharacterized protein n=1 Tax=Dermacentor andersoni TaxID=34620 RepID=UPI002155E22B|nr:TNF receptor-associated factor 6-like [Dermacentor andersoni]